MIESVACGACNSLSALIDNIHYSLYKSIVFCSEGSMQFRKFLMNLLVPELGIVREQNMKLLEESRVCAITGLPNARAFMEYFNAIIGMFSKEYKISLMFIEINTIDPYSIDETVIALAKCFSGVGNSYVYASMGKGKFAAILPKAGIEAATMHARWLSKEFSARAPQNNGVEPGLCIGIAEYNGLYEDDDFLGAEVWCDAERALEKAQRGHEAIVVA